MTKIKKSILTNCLEAVAKAAPCNSEREGVKVSVGGGGVNQGMKGETKRVEELGAKGGGAKGGGDREGRAGGEGEGRRGARGMAREKVGGAVGAGGRGWRDLRILLRDQLYGRMGCSSN